MRGGSARSERQKRGISASAASTISMRHQTSGSAGNVMSLPRIAVNPQSSTQKWIWSCALVVVVTVARVSSARERRGASRQRRFERLEVGLGPLPARFHAEQAFLRVEAQRPAAVGQWRGQQRREALLETQVRVPDDVRTDAEKIKTR